MEKQQLIVEMLEQSLTNNIEYFVAENTTTKLDMKEHIKVVKPKNKKWTLEELYELIGCNYIDIIELSPTKSMIIDEEARLANKNANDFATNILRFVTKQNVIIPILGNVLIVNNSSIR
jgi:hypothetical protein